MVAARRMVILLLATGLPCVKSQTTTAETTTTGCPPDGGAAHSRAYNACVTAGNGNATVYCPCWLQWLFNGTGKICFGYGGYYNPWVNPMMMGNECAPTTTSSTTTATVVAGATTAAAPSATATLAPCPSDNGALANVVLAGCAQNAGNSNDAQCSCFNAWWATVGACPGITTRSDVSVYVAGKNQCASLQTRTSGGVTAMPAVALSVALFAGLRP